MGAIVLTKCKAVCLFFASLFVSIASSYARLDKFTTTPKDKEVFVGRSVQFDWDYVVPDVNEVRFGLVVDPGGQDKEVAIYVKVKNGTLKFNHMSESVEWIRSRVKVIPNRRASFKIDDVQMKDSGTFFCLLVRGDLINPIRDKVKLTVVDLLIDHQSSTQSVKSWQGHKIYVVCAVKLSQGERNAKFSWIHIPSNRTVPRINLDDTRSKSYLTMTTYKDEDFEALQCRAQTKKTVKYHVINIIRLSSPTQPRNLKAQKIFDGENGVPLIQLRWEPPQSSGGTQIEKYIVSYRPKELLWKQATNLDTEDTVLNNLRLQHGTTYHARVRAKNKAGISPSSNEVEINLEDIMVATFSSSRPLNTLSTFLTLLQFMLWLI